MSTHATSDRAPERADASVLEPGSADWERDLDAAFAVLLDHPVDAFDPSADYAVYYRNVPGCPRLLGLLDTVEALTQVLEPDDAAGRHPVLGVCLGHDWGLDLARSEFEFAAVDDPALASALKSLPDSAWLDRHHTLLHGASVAAALSLQGLPASALATAFEADVLDLFVTLRVVTDGSLRHAMRAATRTGAGPDGLLPNQDELALVPFAAGVFGGSEQDEPSAGVEAERDRLLAEVRDPRLRAHLWSPYLDRVWDRREDGTLAGASPAARYRSISGRPETTFLVAWDLAYYGEVSLAVVQTGGLAPA